MFASFLLTFLLHGCQANVQFGFLFGWQCSCDILLDTTQHEWTQNGVQLLNHIFLARFVAHTKVFVKLFGVSKDIWENKLVVEHPSSTDGLSEIVTYLA